MKVWQLAEEDGSERGRSADSEGWKLASNNLEGQTQSAASCSDGNVVPLQRNGL